MKKKKFKYGWLEKRRFSGERKRQLRCNTQRYTEAIDEDSESYWQVPNSQPQSDSNQLDVLTDFSRDLLLSK